MKKLMLIASLFIVGIATAGMIVNRHNPLPHAYNPMPPCMRTNCQ